MIEILSLLRGWYSLLDLGCMTIQNRREILEESCKDNLINKMQ